MLNYKNFIISSKAMKIICNDQNKNRLSHAYMFLSVDQNLISAFCEKVACLILNGNLEENNTSQRISKKVHPDVSFFGTEKAIDSETVARIIESAQISPFEAEKKVFVIMNFQDANESCQNKILKTLEEPPANTFFVIGTSSCSKILPTIMSRVKIIDIDEMTPENISTLLVEIGISNQNANLFASCASGNASFAESLATDESFIEFYNKIVSCFFDIKGSRDVLVYSSYFSQKNINHEEFINISMLIIRDLMMILSNKDEMVVSKNILPKLKVISSSLNFDALTTLMKFCFESKKKLQANVSSTAVVDGFLFKIAEVKVKCRK